MCSSRHNADVLRGRNGAEKTKSAEGGRVVESTKKRVEHGPRRGGFCTCEIVANAYRSRTPLLSFSRHSSRLPFAFAVFPRSSIFFHSVCMRSNEKRRKEERERERRRERRLREKEKEARPSSLLFPTFSIFLPTRCVSSFPFLLFILFCDHFACNYVYFRAI